MVKFYFKNGFKRFLMLFVILFITAFFTPDFKINSYIILLFYTILISIINTFLFSVTRLKNFKILAFLIAFLIAIISLYFLQYLSIGYILSYISLILGALVYSLFEFFQHNSSFFAEKMSNNV